MNILFKYSKVLSITLSGLILLMAFVPKQDEPTAKQIIEKSYYNQRSNSFTMEVSMEVIRPKWSRELGFTTWSLGSDLGMMGIKNPAKERGINFLRIKAEGWNWIPSINRVVKISPSQMSQSWMGSDFTNEDLLKEASIVHDYNHKIIGTENYEGKTCYKIEAIPKKDAAVVWGKLLVWVDQQDMLQLKTEYYSESDVLINTLVQGEIKEVGQKRIATQLTMTPANKEGYKTIVHIRDANFSADLNEDFFSIANLKTR